MQPVKLLICDMRAGAAAAACGPAAQGAAVTSPREGVPIEGALAWSLWQGDLSARATQQVVTSGTLPPESET